MSLILDALRKADSERERGSVPGLHAQPLPALPVEAPERPKARNWQWAVIGVAAGVVVSLAWYLTRPEAPRRPPGSAETPVAIAPPASRGADSANASVAAPATALPARPSPPLPVAEPAPWPGDDKRQTNSRPQAPAPEERPATERSAAPAASQSALAPTNPAMAAPATVPGSAHQGASPPVPESPIYARDQLPQQIRSGLPPLAITGSIYSPRAADRTLIVNGRLLRENDQVGADLLIEQIRQKSAILRFKGYRFEVMF